MGHEFIHYILLVLAILALTMLAQKIKIAYPIILVVGGLLISFIPGVPLLNINPELIFIIFLPPLLYEAAWYTSWKEFWRWRRVIGSFAFLIVLATSLVVALVASSFIPGISLAMGFLLGGIVSPPDAVSAGAIMKNVKVPKGLAAIIEGESLLNDASSLIVFRFALIAVETGRFVFHEAALNFFWVILAGIGIGLIIGYLFLKVHQWLPGDVNTNIIMTIVTPYAMYLAAESLHVSGVLAVVSGGLFLSVRQQSFLNHNSRLHSASVWSALAFILNGIVFMIIGLALPHIVNGLGNTSLSMAIWYGILVTLVLMLSRVLATLGASAFTVFISRYIKTADSNPGWRGPLVFGWAGMRGVVSLAAALSIPEFINNGAFEQRNLLLFITFIVILLTLVIQGLTLPWLIKKLQLKDTQHQFTEEEQRQMILHGLSEKTYAYLHNQHSDKITTNKGIQQLAARWDTEYLQAASEEETQVYREVYLKLLSRQRKWVNEMNKDIELDEELIRKQLMMLDVEEEKVRLRYE